MSKKYMTIPYEYVHQTDDAVLILHCGDKIWILRNCIEDGHELDFSEDYALGFEMGVEEWFAIEKDLV